MDYSTLKLIHVSCVALSGTGFAIRGAFSFRNAARLKEHLFLRTAPHVIDTVLLGSAVTMVWQLGGSVLALPWLQVKLVLLPCYVGLGAFALSPRRSRTARAVTLLLACMAFAGIVISAVTKRPLGFPVG